MNRISCPQEANVSDAARTGCWNDSTKAHVKQCPHCREIAWIAEWMHMIARNETSDHILNEPELIFLNAQIAAMREAREKALRPLLIAEFVVRVAVMLALAAGVLWAWFGFRSVALSPLSAYLHVPQSALICLAALATCLITLLFTKLAQPVLIEE